VCDGKKKSITYPKKRDGIFAAGGARLQENAATENCQIVSLGMNRSDLIKQLVERFSQLKPSDADFAVTTILQAMSDALMRGHRIEVRGFGSFSVTQRAPRMGRNPRSGAAVTIPQNRVPHFKPGKALRAAVDR